MANVKEPSQMKKVVRGVDFLIMAFFTMGVVAVIALFIYVLSLEKIG